MFLRNSICMDGRLSQSWDIGYCCEMGAFWSSSESLTPSVPLPEVQLDGASGALACHLAFYLAFLSLHQSQTDGEVDLGKLVLFHALQQMPGIIFFDPCIVLQESCLAAKQMFSKWLFLLLVNHIGLGVACFSPLLVQKSDCFWTHNKN